MIIRAKIIFEWEDGTKEILMPECFGDDNITYQYKVLDEKFIMRGKRCIRLIKKAKLIAVNPNFK